MAETAMACIVAIRSADGVVSLCGPVTDSSKAQETVNKLLLVLGRHGATAWFYPVRNLAEVISEVRNA